MEVMGVTEVTEVTQVVEVDISIKYMKKIILTLVVPFFFILSSFSVSAEYKSLDRFEKIYQNALSEYQNKNYDTAISLIQQYNDRTIPFKCE
jgi:outer membrane protein assembly factor BamD (BamD/ComL family)